MSVVGNAEIVVSLWTPAAVMSRMSGISRDLCVSLWDVLRGMWLAFTCRTDKSRLVWCLSAEASLNRAEVSLCLCWTAPSVQTSRVDISSLQVPIDKTMKQRFISHTCIVCIFVHLATCFSSLSYTAPIGSTARSTSCSVFVGTNTGIVGSNPIQAEFICTSMVLWFCGPHWYILARKIKISYVALSWRISVNAENCRGSGCGLVKVCTAWILGYAVAQGSRRDEVN
jgi:hypothetical protein